MKRLLYCLVLTATLCLAQHDGPRSEEAKVERTDAKEERDLTGWKWANFAILAGLLGWLVAKNAGPFFEGRSREIQKGISDAARLKYEAEQRARAMEDRISGLQAQIQEMRAEAQQELQAEGKRIQAETAQLLAKIHSQAEQDIASAAKAARQELKAHSVELAIQLAETKLRGRIDSETQGALVSRFAADLRARRPELN